METKEEKIGRIKKFLEGGGDQNYITAIEGDYNSNQVTLIIDDPVKGKYMEVQKFQPFLFMKDLTKLGKQLFNGDKEAGKKAKKYYDINFKPLRTDKHDRLENGYKYLVTCGKDVGALQNFFFKAGYNLFKDPNKLFLTSPSTEQFLMSTGKRLFKGFETYKEVHKFYFDIETTSLKPEEGNIFLIGMKDNRGFEKVLTIDKNNPIESERQMIIDFFQIIVDLKPTIIAGYNSEAFDFHYILGRAGILGINLNRRDDDGNLNVDVRSSLNPEIPLKRKSSTIKFGGETENYEKTLMWGMNVIDISHSVRATKAINSEIKGWGLKYICQYENIAKPNRMYVKGDQIFQIWDENKNYYISKHNNQYEIIPTQYQDKPEEYIPKLKNIVQKVKVTEDKSTLTPKHISIYEYFGGEPDNVALITGSEIVHQYLLDDLFETEMVDEVYNQSNFMMGKILPTDYVRASTMGNASKWKMLMTTYSYQNLLAIPITDRKVDIVGGLSRLYITGYAKNVLKMDFSSLYPSIQLTHNVFPSLDITGVMEAMLHYFRDNRSTYKALSKKHDKLYKKFGNPIDKELANLYDVKQLPVKILANSQFGAVSSPALFNWGDNSVGEEITCTGRQYLRSMVHHFMKYGFKPIVLDTDGVNFSIPDNSEKIICYNDKNEPYKGKRKVLDENGKETDQEEEYILTGYPAVLEEYNDKYMYGVMGLSLDGLYAATINISRKNYADLYLDGKIKIVGNSLKSSTLQAYVENTFKKSIELLLHGKGKEFIELYYSQLERIYNKQIPLIEIANKARVKERVSEYQKNLKIKTKKDGSPMNRKAHMELLIEANLDPSLGQNIYYVNNGTRKSHGDLGNSYLVDEMDFIANPNKTGDYNVPRYIDIFNKRMEVFLVCFGKEVRETLLKTNPELREIYTDKQMELVSGMPMNEKNESEEDVLFIEDYEKITSEGIILTNVPLFEMEDREVVFWNKSKNDPRKIFSEFTTQMSNVRLLNNEEKIIKNQQEEKIMELFKLNGIKVKNELDYLIHDDLFIKYSNKFIHLDPQTLKESVEILPDLEWILSKFEYGSIVDMEIIDKSVYS